MNFTLFAMPPPGTMGLSLLIGFIVLSAGIYFLRSRKLKAGRSPGKRLVELAGIALLAGPALGFLLAFLACWLGGVSPLDIGYTYKMLTIVGAISGVFGAVAFVAGGIGARTSGKHRRCR